MSLFSPLWYVLILALCLLAADRLHAYSAFFRARVAENAGERHAAIDGLRAYCALAVFFTHAATNWYWHAEGRWGVPEGGPAHGYGLSGEAGVSLFFMITGFLFWRRALRAGEGMDARSLFRSRIRRIVPMYLASVVLVLVVVAVVSGLRLQVSPVAFLKELRPWLSFGFMETGELNGVRDAHNINAVYWTLAFEWMFYLALPLLARFARGPSSALLYAAVVYFGIQAPVTLNFLAGALAALAVETRFFERRLPARLASPLFAPVAFAAMAGLFWLPSAYSPAATALMFVPFILVVHGNSLFGLLTLPAARLLGTVSYSLYLVHCIVLYVVMRAVDAVVPVASLSPQAYWSVAALAALAAVALSCATYRVVEYPFIEGRTAPAPALGGLESASAR